jgi:CheY-like chemotaxis protein
VLVVDDDREYRRLLLQHITTKWPKALVEEFDPVTSPPLDDKHAASFDVVLLDYLLGKENGLDYLRRFRQNPAFPPVIMLTAEGNERLAVSAIKLGAADYIPKRSVTHAALVGSIEEALDARGAVGRYEEQEPKPKPQSGIVVKGLRILRKIGEGGISCVYLAQREGDATPVVLKVFDHARRNENEEQLLRFFQECELLSRLNHPGIVRLIERGSTDNWVYVAMEYFPAGSLRDHMKGPLPPARALAWMRPLLDALEVVHKAGIVHRDLKPANVMLRQDGSPVLIDFGAAKSLGETTNLTRKGTVLGTPHYMSPEHSEGVTPDARSDLYAAGAMLYEMLTGTVPYNASTALAVCYKHRHAPIPQLPPALARAQPLINRLLAKDRNDRYSSAQEVRESLGVLAQL